MRKAAAAWGKKFNGIRSSDNSMGTALLDSRKEQALQHDFVNSKRQQVNQLQMAYINGDLKAGGRRVNTN